MKNGVCALEGCPKIEDALGYCDTHYKRIQIHGDVNFSFYSPEETRNRFWSKVAVTSNPEKCWHWKGTLDKKGYGYSSITISGKNWRAAHRISYYFYYGIDPKSLFVCHKCDNPKCVNPFHLFLGTQKDNLSDMARKGRSARGERNGMRRLTENQVVDIKRQLIQGNRVCDIAKQYGVVGSTITLIKKEKNWSYIRIS